MSGGVLGEKSPLPASPAEAILHTVPAPKQRDSSWYVVRLTCPEFTSLCPVTGQPDFAIIIVDYVPDKLLIESKAFKLFMGSFRNHGAFHEQCTCTIGERLRLALQPSWLRVSAIFNPRGGIPIDVFWESNPMTRPTDVPSIETIFYRGR